MLFRSDQQQLLPKKLGRNFFGVEANEQYCAWAYKRIEMAESNPSIQGYTDGVFWERNTSAEQKSARFNSLEDALNGVG